MSADAESPYTDKGRGGRASSNRVALTWICFCPPAHTVDHWFSKGRTVSVTLPSPKSMLRSWHLSKQTNTCCQWSVPWMRTHRRASRELVMRTRGSWDRVPPNAGFHSHCAWHFMTPATAPQEGSPWSYFGETGEIIRRFLLEIYPRVSAFCSLFLIYSNSFVFHWASAHKIHLCVGGSSPNLLTSVLFTELFSLLVHDVLSL